MGVNCGANGGEIRRVWSVYTNRRRDTRCLSDWSSDVCSSDPSRRRHTRCLSDWSSDVCSSDLIDLSVSMFDWAKFRRTKGAIKLHLLLDHDGYLPSFAVVTEGKTSEI